MNPNSIQHDVVAERTAAIVRSIASGNNACGTLFERQSGSLNTAFIAEAVRPTLAVYEDEAEQLRRENAALRRDVESKRQALESAVANIHDIASIPGVGDAFRAALPGHPHLN